MPSVLPPFVAAGLNALGWATYTLTTTDRAINKNLTTFARNDPNEMDAMFNGMKKLARITPDTTTDDAYAFGKFMYSNDWYGSEKLVFLVHNAAILPWGLLSSIQFSQTIRKHYINIHRWNGRFLLLSLIPASITGFQLGMTSHAIMSSMRVPLAVITFMYPMYNALMGYLALVAPPPGRKKSASIALHQYYLTKTSIFLVNIPIIRIVFGLLLALSNRIPILNRATGVQRYVSALGLTFGVCVAGGLVAAEWWGQVFKHTVGRVEDLSRSGVGEAKKE